MRRGLLVRLLVAGVALAALLASCGVPEDSSPRAISDDALPIELTDRPSATTTIPVLRMCASS